jgi:hypothetical protein
MFSTSCCSFDVSEVCIESRRPPKGNLALNWSDSMGRMDWEVALGAVMGSVAWLLLVEVVEVTVVERTTWVTVVEEVVVVVFSPGLVEQFGGRWMPSSLRSGGASLPRFSIGDGDMVVLAESVRMFGDRDAHSLEGGDGL